MTIQEGFRLLPYVMALLHFSYVIYEKFMKPQVFCPKCYRKVSRMHLRRHSGVCEQCESKQIVNLSTTVEIEAQQI